MAEVTFRIDRHTIRDCQVVEVVLEGRVIATITPRESGIRVISAHFKNSSAMYLEIPFEVKP